MIMIMIMIGDPNGRRDTFEHNTVGREAHKTYDIRPNHVLLYDTTVNLHMKRKTTPENRFLLLAILTTLIHTMSELASKHRLERGTPC